MSQVIRIPDSTLKRLERYAIGFDNPGGVIERLLDFYEKYHHDEEFAQTSPEIDSIVQDNIDSNKVKIRLNNSRAKRKYALIPLSDDIRKFFPGYKISFIMKSDIGEIETKVTSAPKGTKIGDPDSGTYIQGGLKPWYDFHKNLRDGDILVIEKLGDKLYDLSVEM